MIAEVLEKAQWITGIDEIVRNLNPPAVGKQATKMIHVLVEENHHRSQAGWLRNRFSDLLSESVLLREQMVEKLPKILRRSDLSRDGVMIIRLGEVGIE